MKRIMVITLFVSLMLASNLLAVEKEEKAAVKPKQGEKVQSPALQQNADTSKRIRLSAKARRDGKVRMDRKFDTFVDRNNNGIDDRRERCLARKPAADSTKTPKK